MKKLLPALIIAALFLACQRSTVAPTQPTTTAFPVSATYYFAADHTADLRDFQYDANAQLAGATRRQVDTMDVASGSYDVDSSAYNFDITPATGLATGYKLVYRKSLQADYPTVTENHLLYYNDHQQLIKDSQLVDLAHPENTQTSFNFSYSGNTVVRDEYWNGDLHGKDTVQTSNGNLVYASSYYLSGSTWTLAWTISYSYSTSANPFYNPTLSNSLGVLLTLGGLGDFVSKNLPENDGFVWVDGANGQVASGSAPDGDYVRFSY